MLAMLIHDNNILKHASSMLNNVSSVLIHTTHILLRKCTILMIIMQYLPMLEGWQLKLGINLSRADICN